MDSSKDGRKRIGWPLIVGTPPGIPMSQRTACSYMQEATQLTDNKLSASDLVKELYPEEGPLLATTGVDDGDLDSPRRPRSTRSALLSTASVWRRLECSPARAHHRPGNGNALRGALVVLRQHDASVRFRYDEASRQGKATRNHFIVGPLTCRAFVRERSVGGWARSDGRGPDAGRGSIKGAAACDDGTGVFLASLFGEKLIPVYFLSACSSLMDWLLGCLSFDHGPPGREQVAAAIHKRRSGPKNVNWPVRWCDSEALRGRKDDTGSSLIVQSPNEATLCGRPLSGDAAGGMLSVFPCGSDLLTIRFQTGQMREPPFHELTMKLAFAPQPAFV
ncbi:hypothetical protein LX32DRAFT_680242 [Colletotrichum zoysiae]|uniref:Uncharacterized protein n=1 Tax=Colletotrichum zoysiae TaxID=1216348 RepID=A0AAD9HPD5_9PEZI|nr:hypothetical protein LX32DRAFT_680242 [Colletotrichum zoysiae]